MAHFAASTSIDGNARPELDKIASGDSRKGKPIPLHKIDPVEQAQTSFGFTLLQPKARFYSCPELDNPLHMWTTSAFLLET